MRLFIAEKPSLAQALIACLPQPHNKKDGYVECGNDDVVTWCFGHIMKQSDPEAYGEQYKTWNITHLPILPKQWKMEVTNHKQFSTIKRLCKDSSIIVNVGDPDRSGQFLIDEVLIDLKVTQPIQRVLINDLNETAVTKALNNIHSNTEHLSLYESALGRARADWLYGMNMTRLYTLLGKEGGYKNVLSIGRVATPLLGLVVERDNIINNFTSKSFYEVAAIGNNKGDTLTASWEPQDKTTEHFDSEGRLVDKSLASAVKERLTDKVAVVDDVNTVASSKSAPKLFSLAKLQIFAAKKYNFNASKTLSVCQSLYDKKIVSYPRSDCEFLPEEHLNDVDGVIASIKAQTEGFLTEIERCDFSLRSPAWNDKKITAHHAIIPSPNKNKCILTDDETKLFNLVATRYIAQFYAVYKSEKTTITIKCNDDQLTAKSVVVLQKGWEVLYKNEDSNDKEEQRLPILSKGDRLTLTPINIITKKTTPPKHFNDASIIEAMCGISRFVTDESIKKVLNETDGLGTSATQAKHVENLFTRKYVVLKGKNFIATDIGKSLIEALPDIFTKPDLTALWEKQLSNIVDKTTTLDAFIKDVESFVSQQTTEGREKGAIQIVDALSSTSCPKCNNSVKQIKPAKKVNQPKKDPFWVHVDKDDEDGCQKYLSDHRGKPVLVKPKKKPSGSRVCPGCKCYIKRLKRNDQDTYFWVHIKSSDATGCKKYITDKDGKPTI
jgi:DNA topoisomerase-3